MDEAHDRGGADEWAHLGIVGKGALTLCGMFPTIGLFSIGPALPVLEAGFAGTPNVSFLVQLVGAIIAPVFALVSPTVGKLVTRFGVKRSYLISLAAIIVAGLAPMVCTSLYQILVFRVLLGIGVAGGFTAGMAGIAKLPESQRHMLYGLVSFFAGIVAIAAFPLVGVLASQGWQNAFLIHLTLAPLALLALALPAKGKTAQTSERSDAAPVGRLAGLPPQLLLMAAVFGWGFVASSLYSPFLLASIGITDSSSVGGILSIMAAASLIGSGSYGFVQKWVGTRAMLLAAPVLSVAGAIGLAISFDATSATIGLAVFAVGLAIFGAAGYAAGIEAIGPDGDSGAATGIINFAIYLPQILFPAVSSAIGTRYGPATVFMLLAGMLAITFAVIAVQRVVPRHAVAAHIDPH